MEEEVQKKKQDTKKSANDKDSGSVRFAPNFLQIFGADLLMSLLVKQLLPLT